MLNDFHLVKDCYPPGTLPLQISAITGKTSPFANEREKVDVFLH